MPRSWSTVSDRRDELLSMPSLRSTIPARGMPRSVLATISSESAMDVCGSAAFSPSRASFVSPVPSLTMRGAAPNAWKLRSRASPTPSRIGRAVCDSSDLARSSRDVEAMARRCLVSSAMEALSASFMAESGTMPSAAAASTISSGSLRWSFTDMLSETSISIGRRRFWVSVSLTAAVGSNSIATNMASTASLAIARPMRIPCVTPHARR